MTNEHPHQFREYLDSLLLANPRNLHAPALQDHEIMLDDSWTLQLPPQTPEGLRLAIADFQSYLLTRMQVSLQLVNETHGPHVIRLKAGNAPEARDYVYQCSAEEITITGSSWIGVQQGLFYLEDLMDLRELPALKITDQPLHRQPLFSPRMVHSGYGLDQFPDSHLNTIAHAGFDSILIFVKGPNETPQGPTDLNDTIQRALKYGLKTYFYSYIDSYKHPDDADADAFFDAQYGTMFRRFPQAKGIILVGESCEFPTKDPRAKSEKCKDQGTGDNQGICVPRHSSGWWPCSDYPQWLNAVKKACQKYRPDADVVFWTYNLGQSPLEPQREMIRNLPKDTTLLATFEMYEKRKFPHHTATQADYSITYPGPSKIFREEAKAAKESNLKLYSMTNTAGRTWDNGVCPYEPVPQQWFKRFKAMLQAHDDWGLSGLMECHHYGWYPSVVSECAKWCFWSPQVDLNQVLRQIAIRDFGPVGGPLAVQAWNTWSEAIGQWAPSFGDQAGPMRVGAAYPFIFLPYLYPYTEQNMVYPSTNLSVCGSEMMHPTYYPEQIPGGTACGRTIHEDLKIMTKAMELWDRGIDLMEQAVAATPAPKLPKARKCLGVGTMFRCVMTTVINAKHWFILNRRLEIENDLTVANQIMDDMENLVEREWANVNRAIPLAESDSILGWEPRSDYQGGAWHLHWKLRQLKNLRENTLPAYRKTLQENPIQEQEN